MSIILVIDDQAQTQMNVLKALKRSGYRIRTLSNDMLQNALNENAMMDRIIKHFQPAMVLINRQPAGFDSVSVFMHFKEKYPELPVMLYALKSDSAIESLRQAISMVFYGTEKPAPKVSMSLTAKPEFRLKRV